MNDIANAQNNMDVEFEYLYSLHQKIRSSYNFTQLSRIQLWWSKSINKKTIYFFFNKEMNNKKSNIFTPCYQMKILSFQLEHFIFWTINKKWKIMFITCLSNYFTKKPTSFKFTKNNHFLIHHLYNFSNIKHNCIITIDVSLTIY
jgi:hypothetical protein